MKTLILTKEFAKVFKWVMKARSTQSGRLVLESICYKDGIIQATDGFRMYFAKVQQENDRAALQNGNGQSNLIPRLIGNLKKESVLVADECELKFPEKANILPNSIDEIAAFAISARLLRETLADFPTQQSVIIRVFKNKTGALPITVESLNGSALACIMPLFINQEKMKPHDFNSFLPNKTEELNK